MKKAGVAIIGIIAAALIFFFAFGGKEIRTEAKAQLNQELAVLQQSGFGIEDRVSKEKEDHFILSFDDPQKIAAYFTMQGTPATAEDIAPFKGMKIGADIYYLKDMYSALSIDLYPVKLPDDISKDVEDEEEKMLIAQMQKMLDEKKLLMHLDIAKDFENFKGYMKDIDQTFKTKEEATTIRTEGLAFSGKTEHGKVVQIDQKLKTLTLTDDKGGEITLQTMTSRHAMTGPSLYDMDASYTVSRLTMKHAADFSGEIDGIRIVTSESVTKGLAQSKINTTIEEIRTKAGSETFVAKGLNADVLIDNIDITALEALQTLDPEKEEPAFTKAFTRLLGKGITLKINDFSAKELVENGKTLGGLSLSASLALDKNADYTLAQQNPMLLLNALDATMTLKLSDAIFAMVAKDPRAMMLMMLIPPKEENGQKSYTIIMKYGKTTVNGISL
jgi:hypothetical protein